MARTPRTETVSRREFLATSSVAAAVGVAGCTTDGGGSDGSDSDGSGSGEGGSGGTTTGGTGRSSGSVSPLTGDGSSTVYPVTSQAAAFWNANPPASDQEYWGPDQYGIDTDQHLADYWAGRYGFETDGDGTSPFRVSIGLSHSGVGIEKVRKGQVDIGASSAPVGAELPEASEEELSMYTDHVVGVDAQPIVVSKAVHDAGVTTLTIEELRDVYRGEITNWSALGGPDAPIQAVGRAEGSGTDTAFRVNVLGDADASMSGVDVRKGQNQQVKTLVANSDNAIAYLALAFVDPSGSVPPISLEIDGTTYTYGENLSNEDYPLARDLHCYTYDGTSKKEAAFLDMVLSDFGQTNFVASNNYVALTEERRRAQRDALPDPVA